MDALGAYLISPDGQQKMTGDVNGDGVANSVDSVLIKAARNDVINLNEISANAFDAADIDGNGTITINDSRLLLYHRAEVSGYNLNY